MKNREIPNNKADKNPGRQERAFDAGSRGLAPYTKPGRGPDGQFNKMLFRQDMASRWISGVLESNGQNGVFRRRLSGREDIVGRAALANLLFEGYPRDDIVQILAMLIAPDGHHLADDEFKLTIERRGKGAPKNDEMAHLVGLFVWERTKDGTKLEAAIASAQERFALTRRQIQNHWKTFNKNWKTAHEELEVNSSERQRN